MKEIIENLERLIVLCTIGALGEALFFLFIILGKIKVRGRWNKIKLIPPKEGLIVVYNHPSLWEPGLLPFLFVLHFLFSLSFRFVPYSTPDKKNYFDRWWFWTIRLFCIPIDRETKKGRAMGLRSIINAINDGKAVMIAAEGGRTDNGDEFKVLKDGKIIIKKKNELTPEDNDLPKIRRFQNGFSGLLKHTDAPILLIWTEGGDKVISIPSKEAVPRGPYFLLPNLKPKTTIIIGERIVIKDISQLEDELLRLSQKGKHSH